MITGMFHKTCGKISYKNHSWSRENLAGIGALIESPPLYENLTAKENLKVRTLLLGLPDSQIHKILKTEEPEKYTMDFLDKFRKLFYDNRN
jgi:ABC-2 type transport system ATP-binding protein